jgi:phenylacetate-CoA ligase
MLETGGLVLYLKRSLGLRKWQKVRYFFISHGKRSKKVDKFLHKEIETMSRKALNALQTERLKWQLRRCYKNSAFYREKFDKSSFSPSHIKNLKDLSRIPFVTKEELREEQKSHPPFGRYVVAPSERSRELHPSSGTTGTPVSNLWGEKDVKNITNWTARTLWAAGVRPGDIIQNALSYGLWVAGLAAHYAARSIGCLVIPIGAAMTEKQIEYLLNPESDVILSTPSFAVHIAEKIREKAIQPSALRVKLGLFGGEPGAGVTGTRERIEEGLGIKAHDYFGLAEIGPTFAAECDHQRGLHWAEDHVLVEVIDPETTERCEPGKPGVLVFTHLTKEVAPMIRYWSNDIASLDPEPCACGRTHARSPGGVIGRADDLIIYKGAKFYPSQVEKVIRNSVEFGDEFRIELSNEAATGLDAVTVVVELNKNESESDRLKSVLKTRLKEELLVTPAVRFENYGTLERTMFKAKRINDLRLK